MKNFKTIGSCVLSVLVVGSTLFSTACDALKKKSDDEIYEGIVKASEDFLNYNGPLTLNVKYIVEENKEKVEDATITLSLDPTNETMFYSLTAKQTEMKLKVFQEGEQPYVMTYIKQIATSGDSTNTTEINKYYSLSKDALHFFTNYQSLMSMGELYLLSESNLGKILEEYAFSFTETKAAYQSIYKEQLSQKKTSYEHAFAEYNLSTSQTIHSTTLEESSEIRKYDFGNNSTNGWGIYTLIEKSKISEKGGKLSQAIAERELSFSQLPAADYRPSEKITTQIDFSYSFDKKSYQAMKVNLSETDEITVYPYKETFKMKFNLNGCITEKSTVAYDFTPEFIFNKLTKDFMLSGCSITWYEDASYTKPFSPEQLSYEQFHDIDCIYGKLTIKDGYAVIINDYCIYDERSKDYKIVFGPILDSDKDKDDFETRQALNGATYTLSILKNTYTSTVNGKPYDKTSNTFSLENGQLYLVEHAKTFTNDDFSIFDFDTSSLWAWGELIIK